MENSDNNKQLTLFTVMLMIITSVFAFDNSSIAYYTMGYAGIIWYVLAALFFFIPSSLMFAEFGSSMPKEAGGVFSWIANSVDIKWAFIGCFVWLANWVILIVSTTSKLWIMLSTTIYGYDNTGSWHLFGLSSTATIGILSICIFCLITWICSFGLDKIAWLSSVGGWAAIALTAVFSIASLFLLFKDGFKLAEPVKNVAQFVVSPRKGYRTTSQVISFLIYAIYAYAGIEALGGVSDKMKNAKKNFPIAMLIGTISITVIYALFIFLWGASANWNTVFRGTNVNLGNTTYVLMSNLGYQLSLHLGASQHVAKIVMVIFSRFGSFTMFLSYFGSFFVIVYMPIKSFILGTPKSLWPKFLPALNKHGMPANAMWLQAVVVCILIALTSFGGKNAVQFYDVLTLMDNLSSALPYLFLVSAFPFFRKNTALNHPLILLKSKFSIWTVTILIDVFLSMGVIAEFISAMSAHQYFNLTLEFLCPVVFGLIGYWLYLRYKHHERL